MKKNIPVIFILMTLINLSLTRRNYNSFPEKQPRRLKSQINNNNKYRQTLQED